MRNLIIIIYYIMISSCNAILQPKFYGEVLYKSVEAEIEFFPYVNWFLNHYYNLGGNRDFRLTFDFFYDFNSTKYGFCVVEYGKNYIFSVDAAISINYNLWKTINDNDKRTLIAHEMGHCLLLLNHVDDHPIMSPYLKINSVIWDSVNDIILIRNMYNMSCRKRQNC